MPIKKTANSKVVEPKTPVELPKEPKEETSKTEVVPKIEEPTKLLNSPKVEAAPPPPTEILPPPVTAPLPVASTNPPERPPLISHAEQSSFPKAPEENFFEDLYKLSRVKSSPIPKLLFLVLMVVCLGAIAFYYYQFAINKKPADITNPQNSYIPVTKQDLSLDLEINNPDDETLVFDSTIIVSGKTNPNARIVINDNETFTALQADSGGQFSKVVDLSTGINQITVYAFDDNGNTKMDTRNIYYSEDKI